MANEQIKKRNNSQNIKRKSNTKNKKNANMTKKSSVRPQKNPSLKVIPIGGLHEIGKNMTLLQYKNQILIIDCGMAFPEDEMYGIDVVLPDFTYLKENQDKIVGLVLTHGHEDHIGGIPYLLKELNVPIYGTKLTLGLVQNKLNEHKLKGKLKTIQPGSKINLGVFKIEVIRTNHSIPDAVCFAIDTPAGLVFHTGDFKIDYTPIDGEPIDLAKLAQIGKKGVTLLLADSTNALRPGYSNSEKLVGQTLGNIFRECKKRIIVSTFSSNVHRIQKIIDHAVACGRKVAISGRSMENVIELAISLGYISIPDNVLVDIKQVNNIPDKKLVIITTGSQGEPMSALARMASDNHANVKLKSGDTIVLSSTPVPGNEKLVSRVVNKLFEKGCNVIYSDILDVHVSGHAAQEELKLIHSLLRPKYFMPVHGEYRHLVGHKTLAENVGTKPKNIFLLGNGDSLTFNNNRAVKAENAVEIQDVFVDGVGVGNIENIVLRDRKTLSENGLVIVVVAIENESQMIVSGPDIITRGFIQVKDNEKTIDEIRLCAAQSLAKCEKRGITDWTSMKKILRSDIKTFIYSNMKKTPVILPVFIDV